MHLLAQTTANLGVFNGIGFLGNTTATFDRLSTFQRFTTLLSLIIGVLTVIAGLWFIFQLFTGAIQWIGSGGDKQALQNAQKRISNALIGIILVVMAYGLIAVVGSVLGIDILSPYSALFT